MICLRNVTYTYPNGIVALKGIDLDIDEERVFVAGLTGSGKSTLLRIFNGLIPNFYGGKLEGYVSIDSNVYFIAQNPDEQLLANRVYDEIAFSLLHRGLDWNEVDRRIRRVADACNIGDLLYRRTYELSDGQKQLVIIASALANDCDCIVLDEPFSHLHPSIAEQILRLLFKHNRTVVLSEHRLEFANKFDRLVWIENGRIAEPKLDLSSKNDIRKSRGSKTVVKVKSLTFGYDEPLFEDVSFEVRKGEIVAVVGKNGCGKTTLLRLIAGLLKPWDGEIEVSGKIAMAFSIPNYHLFERTVAKEVPQELLRSFGLIQLADRHPHSLSFGQAKRVAIAKAFSGDIVLLDEPTAGQDYTFRRKLLEVARSLGKTVILATHDLKLAEECDEVIELS